MRGTAVSRIGLLGCGTVGSAVARAVAADPRLIVWRVEAVAVRDPSKRRDCDLGTATVSHDAAEVVTDPSVDVVVEVMGGLHPAFDVTSRSLRAGRPVVTANKALIGSYGPELRALAEQYGVPLRFEAAVAAGVPVVEPLAALAATDEVVRVGGVLNGTSNYVLWRAGTGEVSLDEAIREAQELGYAEADPTLDLDGSDAAAKLAILAQLAFGGSLRTSDVATTGVDVLDDRDIAAARAQGRVWRLVADVTAAGCATVEPRCLPADHPLARVTGADNAVLVEARLAGTITLAGPGAGGDATASAILRDLGRLRRPRFAAEGGSSGVHGAAGVMVESLDQSGRAT